MNVTSLNFLVVTGFSGCVEYLNISGHTLPVSGHSLMVEVWPSSTLPQPSCSSPGVCLFSPCTEETTFLRTCLSDCQNQRPCRPAIQDRPCMCLQNVSNHFCDICIPTVNEECSEKQHNRPVWIIAVVLPLISILVIACMFAVLYRLKQQDSIVKNENLTHETGQETENSTICFDGNQVPKAGLSTSKGKRLDRICPCQSNEKLNSYGQLMLPSELEYYEIGSICSAFNSDNNSPRLSWHKHLCSTKRLKNDSNQWGDLRRLLGNLKKDNPGEQKCPPNAHQNMSSFHKQSLCQFDAEQQRQNMSCYTKEFPQPGLLEPTHPLSFEEISKLNAPLEPAFSHQALLETGPLESTMTTETSSDCETDSMFTCSESDYDHFNIITCKKYRHKQPFPSECRISQDVFELTSSSTLCQDISKTDPFTMFEQWEKNVNVPLTFGSYAAVFEDIAGMPMEFSHSSDMPSDEEEII